MTQSLSSSGALARIIDGSSIPSFVINKKHKVAYWNTAIERLSGINRDEIIGTDEQWRAFYKNKRPVMADLIVMGASASEVQARYPGTCRKSDLIEGAFEAENFLPDIGKSGKWVRFTASPIRDNDGTIIGAIETLEDITERKFTEEALSESVRSYEDLFEGAHDAIWIHDLEGYIQTANEAAVRLSGYRQEELRGMNVKLLLTDDSFRLANQVSDKLIQQQRMDTPYELRMIKKDGAEAICMVTTNLVTADGSPRGFQNIARDVTQEKRMQENLHYFLQEITRVQEEERKRIARELHDDTAQVLGSVARQIDNLVRKKNSLSASDVAYLKDLRGQLNRGVQSVHRFIQDLRPSLLDDLGLIPAVRSLLKGMKDADGINTDLSLVGEERRLSSEVELLLFRIIQETLTNITKHANATKASVVMEFAKDKVKVTINDNGQGFKLTVSGLPQRGGFGLIGMRERARLLGGTLEMQSTIGKGTTATIEVPN